MTRGPAARPCGSCPYRKDVPSGVWHESEYDKLPRFDLPTVDQPESVFACHQQDGRVCAGWAGTHDMAENLGLKIALICGFMTPEDVEATLDYESPVPLFGSGQEARDHGMQDYEAPDERADRLRLRLLRKGKVHVDREARDQ